MRRKKSPFVDCQTREELVAILQSHGSLSSADVQAARMLMRLRGWDKAVASESPKDVKIESTVEPMNFDDEKWAYTPWQILLSEAVSHVNSVRSTLRRHDVTLDEVVSDAWGSPERRRALETVLSWRG